jgi:hypothetical protein
MKFSEEWWKNYARPENRCVAHRKNGDQCRHPARAGTTVCRVHGGAAPQVKAKARERLELAADRMARQLLGIATTSESEAVKLAAVKDALDRAGLTAKNQVEVELKPWEQLLKDVVVDTRCTRAEHNTRLGLPPPDPAPRPDIVDAEVVPDSAVMGASVAARDAALAEQGDAPAGNAAPRRAPRRPTLDSAEDAVAETTSANRRSTRRRKR